MCVDVSSFVDRLIHLILYKIFNFVQVRYLKHWTKFLEYFWSTVLLLSFLEYLISHSTNIPIIIFHLESFKNIFCTSFLQNEYTFITLLRLDAKKIRHEFNISHFKYLNYCLFKILNYYLFQFFNHKWVTFYKDKIIYIQTNYLL